MNEIPKIDTATVRPADISEAEWETRVDLAACYPAGGEDTRPASERFSGDGPEHAGPAIL